MASLTQAEYTRDFRNWVETALGSWRYWIKQRRLARDARHVIFEVIDPAADAFLSDWTLTGYKRGQNTDDDGRLWIDLTDAVPNVVSVYKDSALGGGDLVAQGSANDGNTATLAEQNNSGLSGTVAVGTVTAAQNDAYLVIEGPFQARANDIDSDLADKDLSALLNAKKTEVGSAYNDTILPALDAAVAASKTLSDNYILDVWAKEIESGSLNIITNSHSVNADKSITVTRSGVLYDMFLQFARAAANIQYLEDSTVVCGAVAQGSGTQQGNLTKANQTVREYIRPTQITFRCTKALDASGNETFAVEQASYLGDGKISGEAVLTVDALWESTAIGLICSLDRTATDDHGGGDLSAWAFAGLTSSFIDGPNDKLYADIAVVGTTATLNLYSSSAMTDATKVATGTGTTGAGIFTIPFTSLNGSNISGSVTSTDPPAADTDFDITLHSAQVDDTFTVTPTNDEAGVSQAFIGRQYGIGMGTNAAHTIPDAILHDSFDILDESAE